MNKAVTFALIGLGIAGITGCADTESIPSDNYYQTISEKRMPYYCKQEVARKFGIYAEDIYLFPIEYDRGAKIIYGKYSEDSMHLKEFACIFNPDDTYAGIKMQHTNLKNKLCYPDR